MRGKLRFIYQARLSRSLLMPHAFFYRIFQPATRSALLIQYFLYAAYALPCYSANSRLDKQLRGYAR